MGQQHKAERARESMGRRRESRGHNLLIEVAETYQISFQISFPHLGMVTWLWNLFENSHCKSPSTSLLILWPGYPCSTFSCWSLSLVYRFSHFLTFLLQHLSSHNHSCSPCYVPTSLSTINNCSHLPACSQCDRGCKHCSSGWHRATAKESFLIPSKFCKPNWKTTIATTKSQQSVPISICCIWVNISSVMCRCLRANLLTDKLHDNRDHSWMLHTNHSGVRPFWPFSHPAF